MAQPPFWSMGIDAQRGPLHGMTVVVTRAADQAEPLVSAILRADGEALMLPGLTIRHIVVGSAERERVHSGWYDAQTVFAFTSTNAVRGLAAALEPLPPTPTAGPCVAIGAATAATLSELGIANVEPVIASSEALTAMLIERQPTPGRLILVRGMGGRQYISAELRKRGWTVDEVVTYERRLPEIDTAPMLVEWRAAAAVVATYLSAETASNVKKMAERHGDHAVRLVLSTPAVVVSERVATRIRALGWRAAVGIAGDPTPEAVVRAIWHLGSQ